MQCYSYTCFNFTNTPHPSCAPPKVITCSVDPHSLVPPNRCMTQRMTAKLQGAVVHQEIRGCADNLQCRSTRLCDEAKNHDNIKQCETSCCEGDLCNREGPVARQIAADRMAPSGKMCSIWKTLDLSTDLSCYACSNATEPGQPPSANCSHPIKQQCGYDPLTSAKQDRCITITMSTKMPGPLGRVLYQEMRHCSSEHYCEFCAFANATGNLATCKAACCYGNMCNNEGMQRVTSTSRPPRTTIVQEEKFARQGAHSVVPTENVTTTSTGVSYNHWMSGLSLFMGVFVVLV
ncbi:hypothetical protein QZH41_016223 [Actinostola sp. cb2023]|nr:hypothetical protein QZH41_016223 [Actinostola sp. cb2023]